MNSKQWAVLLVPMMLVGGCAQLSGDSGSADPCADEVNRLERLISSLETELEQSHQANLKLQADNAELAERIEMLKVLDQAVEEKRKSYSNQ